MVRIVATVVTGVVGAVAAGAGLERYKKNPTAAASASTATAVAISGAWPAFCGGWAAVSVELEPLSRFRRFKSARTSAAFW